MSTDAPEEKVKFILDTYKRYPVLLSIDQEFNRNALFCVGGGVVATGITSYATRSLPKFWRWFGSLTTGILTAGGMATAAVQHRAARILVETPNDYAPKLAAMDVYVLSLSIFWPTSCLFIPLDMSLSLHNILPLSTLLFSPYPFCSLQKLNPTLSPQQIMSLEYHRLRRLGYDLAYAPVALPYVESDVIEMTTGEPAKFVAVNDPLAKK